ncbi:MAG TPA: MarR family transcriptional regulator [Polyangiaceae bacterium]
MSTSHGKSEAAELLTEIVLLVFRLEADFIAAAEAISAPAGLTAARWKVLGAVLSEPRTVAEIGRVMGLARQSVQRLADILVEEGLATYSDNPDHKYARLFAPTKLGRAAVTRLADRQATWANQVSRRLSVKKLTACRETLKELIDEVERDSGAKPTAQRQRTP